MPLAFAPLQTIPEGEVFELRLVDSRSDDDLSQPLPPWDPIKASTSALVTDPVGAAEVQLVLRRSVSILSISTGLGPPVKKRVPRCCFS